MICVSIGRGRHRHVIAEHKHLVEQGATLVELRLDYINGAVNLKRVLPARPSPVVITLRRPQDGGKWSGAEDQRRMILRAAIADGVEYVDLEEDAAAQIPRYGKTKRIISYHNFQKTPDDLESIHARLAKLDADIVKLATMANHPQDNVRMLELVRASKVPMVGLCMGDIGTPSRILAGRFGAAFSYATFHHERALAPGQLSFDQMTKIYHYDQIGPETEVFGVIGDPIAHSLSPLVHNAAMRGDKLDRVYIPFRVPRDDVPNFLASAPRLGVRGLSVTIPHKEAAFAAATDRDKDSEAIQAANTLVFDARRIRAYNTDCRAAMDSLAEALGEVGPDSHRVALQSALVMGAGGAAKAIAHGLVARGVRSVVISSRTAARAEALAKPLGCKTVAWEERHGVPADVIVNCTPIGMHPNVDESPYDAKQLKPTMLIFDTVYNPENTLFVKQGREAGCAVITGAEMFIRQAAMQYQLFHDREPPTGVMKETLRRAIGAAKY